MEDFIAAINTIENNHQGYKRNILSALNNHGFSCTSLDAFLSLQAGKELPADAMLFEAFLPPRVLVLDHDRLTASYGPSLASSCIPYLPSGGREYLLLRPMWMTFFAAMASAHSFLPFFGNPCADLSLMSSK
ncbi:hypothetical protein QOT17_016937 [Balamuthia mandrillaris]